MKTTPRKMSRAKDDHDPHSEMPVGVARGRLKGALNSQMDDSMDMSASKRARRAMRQKQEVEEDPEEKPYVIKLFDRHVNVHRFDEDTPLYPICRDWFYDRSKAPKVPEPVDPTPNYYTGREPLLKQLQKGRIDRVAALPPPNDEEEVQKIPYCEPPAMENGLNLFTADYDWDNPVVTTEELTNSYLDRWRKVRQAWNLQSHNYFQRYHESARVLEAIKKN